MFEDVSVSLFPRARYDNLKSRLKAQPTTGVLIIEWLTQQDLAGIHIFGFDFFASKSLSGSRSADQVPHDFPSEKEFVEALMKADPRITLHQM